MDKRLIFAIVLSLLVAVGFGLLSEKFGGPDGPSRAAAAPTVAPSDADAAAIPGTPAADPTASTPPAAPVAPAPVAAAAEASPAEATPAVAIPETTETIETPFVTAAISSRFGALTSWVSKDRRFFEDVGGQRVQFDAAAIPGGLMGVHCYEDRREQTTYEDLCPSDYAIRRQADGTIVLESLPTPTATVKVTQTYAFGGPDYPYLVRRSITLEPANPGTVVRNLVTWMAVGMPKPLVEDTGGFLRPAANVQQGVCRVAGELERKPRADIGSGWQKTGVMSYVAVEDTYFVTALGFEKLDPPGRQDTCLVGIAAEGTRPALLATLRFMPIDLAAQRTYSLAAYLGPKDLDRLQSVPGLPALDETIDFGWFSPIAVVMLRVMQFFQGLVVSWGVAIILLTVAVRIVLFPLTHWSAVSMKRMGALKPFMDEINAKYKDDKQRRTQAIMDLYKTHKVNPLSGCLPMLIQMPIWIALYRAIGSSADLYHTSFLYLDDLTQADPYYALPLLLGVSMFVQQKMTPTTMDSAQAKMMLYAMPIMFTVFMLFLPSGLNVYILSSTLLSIVQQQITNRFVGAPAVIAAKGAPGSPSVPPAPPAGAKDGGREKSRRKR